MINNKIIYLVLSVMSFSLFPTIHCMENLQSNEVLELVRTVATEHTERLNRTEEQLNQLVENFSNFVNFTNTLNPIGAIMEYSGNAAVPNNWLECDGRAVSRVDYQELLQVIGVTYGAGDQLHTFNIPDRRGKVAVGIGSDNSTGDLVTTATAPNIALGKTFGEERHLLTDTEMTKTSGACAGGPHLVLCPVIPNHPNTTVGQPHNNMQPSIFIKFYIRAK